VHHVGILYGQFMMHGQRNIKLVLYIFVLKVLVKKYKTLEIQHCILNSFTISAGRSWDISLNN